LRLGIDRFDLCDFARAVEVASTVAVAVDDEEDLRVELAEAIDDCARAEVRRAARPDRAEARCREQRDDGLGDVRQIRDDTVAARDAEPHQPGADRCDLLRELRIRHRRGVLEAARLGARDERRMIVASRERVLRVAQLGAWEPRGARHRVAREDTFVVPARAYAEVLPDR
jgi:hypothetical protein